MPPVRRNSKSSEDMSAKIKPMKTVRTHEENQERAYVAASRRSDRSLEARIESARRASEIHKKRTGRAFRITEEDVLNEQYYEEVDDDIPASIRRLQMHLNGLYHWNNPRFDSYMISNYAKHHAAWIAQRYGQQSNSQYANPPIFSNSFGQVSPGVGGNGSLMPSASSPTTTLPPQMHGQMPVQQGAHQRSASIATPSPGFHSGSAPFSPTDGSPTEEQRRLSLPVQQSHTAAGAQMRPKLTRTTSGSTAVSSPNEAQASQYSSHPQFDASTLAPAPSMNATCQPQEMMMGSPLDDNMSPTSFTPFSPTMPLNMQQIWDGSNQPMSHMSYMGNPMGYQYNPNAGSSKSQADGQTYNTGIHQTLTANPLGIADMGQQMNLTMNGKVVSPAPGAGQKFDTFWSGDSSGHASNMGVEFEDFFNFPGNDEHTGDNFLDDFVNTNEDVPAAE